MAAVGAAVDAAMATSSETRDQSAALSALADSMATPDRADELALLVRELTSERIPLVVSRPVLGHVAELASNAGALGQDGLAKVAAAGIESIAERRAAFEEIDGRMREIYGQALAEREDYLEAARVLAGINLESGRYTDSEKAQQYVRITELFLEEDETVEAERFVNRASQYVYSCPDPLIQVRHKVSYARILDSKRRFLDAAFRYYQLSTDSHDLGGRQVAEEDLLHLLTKAVTCALLASAGPQRTRVLNLLYKDERARTLATHWPVLEKMFMQRILNKSEVRVFEQTLEPHQRAVLADKSTVLERAVIEHNVLAAGRIYLNISFAELARLLDIDAVSAEAIAARMIKEKRLAGRIDQVDQVLIFSATAPDALSAFDGRISDLCLAINAAYDRVDAAHPALLTSTQ